MSVSDGATALIACLEAKPAEEIERLAAHSYDLVCAKLTRKQQAELAGLAA